MWYDEIKDYNWKNPEISIEKTGHFTQVVWKDTKEVGFGVAISPSGEFYAVANYYPAGNFVGNFKSNVLQPTPASKKEFAKTQNIVNKQPTAMDKNNMRSNKEEPEETKGCC